MREDGFATVKDIVFIVFFFFFALLLLFSAYEKMTKTRDKNGAFTALKSSTHSSKEENEETSSE